MFSLPFEFHETIKMKMKLTQKNIEKYMRRFRKLHSCFHGASFSIFMERKHFNTEIEEKIRSYPCVPRYEICNLIFYH